MTYILDSRIIENMESLNTVPSPRYTEGGYSICAVCNKVTEPARRGSPKLYCSDKCKRKSKNSRFRQCGFSYKGVCPTCGQSFKTKNRKQVHCSYWCVPSTSGQRDFRGRPTKSFAEYLVPVLRWVLTVRECPACDTLFLPRSWSKRITAGVYCSEQCRVTSWKETLASLTERECIRCSAVFQPKQLLAVYCSDKCLRASRRERQGGSLKSKCQKLGIPYHPINFRKIWERDQGVCYICQQFAPWELRGTLDDSAPELEHKLPISAVRTNPEWAQLIHTEENVAVAHRKCNREKSDKISNMVPRLPEPGYGTHKE